MDTELLKQAISDAIFGGLVGLHWKMINLGVHGKIKPKDQIKALHLYLDKLDLNMANHSLQYCIPASWVMTITFLLVFE